MLAGWWRLLLLCLPCDWSRNWWCIEAGAGESEIGIENGAFFSFFFFVFSFFFFVVVVVSVRVARAKKKNQNEIGTTVTTGFERCQGLSIGDYEGTVVDDPDRLVDSQSDSSDDVTLKGVRRRPANPCQRSKSTDCLSILIGWFEFNEPIHSAHYAFIRRTR